MLALRHRRIPGLVAAALVLGLATAPSLHAQDAAPRPWLAAVGGLWQYDLSGTGTSGFGALRAAVPIAGPLLLEPGLTVARYRPNAETRVTLLVPEVQLQVEFLRGGVRPFVGAGAGVGALWGGGGSELELSLSAGAGARARLSPAWGMHAELRVRSIDPWSGSVAEWTVGFARRL